MWAAVPVAVIQHAVNPPTLRGQLALEGRAGAAAASRARPLSHLGGGRGPRGGLPLSLLRVSASRNRRRGGRGGRRAALHLQRRCDAPTLRARSCPRRGVGGGGGGVPVPPQCGCAKSRGNPNLTTLGILSIAAVNPVPVFIPSVMSFCARVLYGSVAALALVWRTVVLVFSSDEGRATKYCTYCKYEARRGG